MTDTIADMFTQIQNGQSARKTKITIPHSRVKMAILNILKNGGKISNFHEVKVDKFNRIELDLGSRNWLIKRISRPGRRVYAANGKIPQPRGPEGLIIISTSEGMMTGEQARQKGLGGEVIGEVI